jgi:flagellar basal body-associated protein FliL
MGEREQVRPLTPAADRQSSDEEGASRHHKKRSRKCCVFIAAIFVILVVAIVVMRFTAFRVKDPIIKMNGVTVTQLELTSGTIPKPGLNMSLIAEYVSV